MSEKHATRRSFQDLVAESSQKRQRATPRTTIRARTTENEFAKIFENKSTSLDEKVKEVAQTLSFVESKEELERKLHEFHQFQEELQEERKADARAIIELTDTGAYAHLKTVMTNMGNGLKDFEERIEPLIAITEAIFNLRANNVTAEVFNELREERKLYEANQAKIKELEKSVQKMVFNNHDYEIDIIHHKGKKAFGFFGPIVPASKVAIEDLTQKVASNKAEIEKIKAEIEVLKTVTPGESKYQEFAEEKAKLRELLDITSEEHINRQKELVQTARKFIDTSDADMATVLEHFGDMDQQIGKLVDSNYDKSVVFGVINEAANFITTENARLRAEYEAMPEATDIDRLRKEEKLRTINKYIEELETAQITARQTTAELTSSRVRIDAMKDTNIAQKNVARQLQSSGIAGIADNLATTLQAVSAAAIGETNETARMFIGKMNDRTLEISKREIIRNALEQGNVNEDIINALDKLAEIGETVQASNNIRRESIQRTYELLDEVAQRVDETQAVLGERESIVAESANEAVNKKIQG